MNRFGDERFLPSVTNISGVILNENETPFTVQENDAYPYRIAHMIVVVSDIPIDVTTTVVRVFTAVNSQQSIAATKITRASDERRPKGDRIM